jgi:hypothetical protein
MRSNRQPLVQLCGKLLRERKVCTSDILAFASSHDQPRSGPNNSERESTSGRSTNYGSGRLIQVFRDIGRIFSLLFLLNRSSPIGHPTRGRVQKRKTENGFVEGKNGFKCVSCGTHGSGRAGDVSFAKTRTPPESEVADWVSGTLNCWVYGGMPASPPPRWRRGRDSRIGQL